MRKNKLLIIPILLSLITLTVYGSNLNELKEKKEEIQNDKSNVSEMLENVKTEKINATSDLDKLDQLILEATDELFVIENELLRTSSQLEEAEQTLIITTEKREKQVEVFKERLKIMYEHKDVGYIELLMDSKDFTEFFKRYEYINKIAEYDNNLVLELQETEKIIEEKILEIDTHKKEIEALKVEVELKRNNLMAAHEEKKIYIAKLESNEETYLNQIAELDAADKEIEKLIVEEQIKEQKRQQESNSVVIEPVNPYTGGTLNWPVPSRNSISSPYGGRTNPISRRTEFHTGIDIPASTGSSIVAAESGTVISSGWVNGYGYTVVINHGNGLSTMYAHNSKLLVSAGESVQRGQTVARAGSTGYSTGPHLHFEVRLNGKHQNPRNYV